MNFIIPMLAPGLLVLGLTLTAPTSAAAQADRLGQVSIPSLRLTSLYCVHLAARSALDPRTTAACEAVGDALVQRSFGANAGAYLRWRNSALDITFAQANPVAWETLALARQALDGDAAARAPARAVQSAAAQVPQR